MLCIVHIITMAKVELLQIQACECNVNYYKLLSNSCNLVSIGCKSVQVSVEIVQAIVEWWTSVHLPFLCTKHIQ